MQRPKTFEDEDPNSPIVAREWRAYANYLEDRVKELEDGTVYYPKQSQMGSPLEWVKTDVNCLVLERNALDAANAKLKCELAECRMAGKMLAASVKRFGEMKDGDDYSFFSTVAKSMLIIAQKAGLVEGAK